MQSDIDDLYNEIKATGAQGGVILHGRVTERTLFGTARVVAPTVSQRELVADPSELEHPSLPLANKDLAKFRSPKDYVDAARRFADPEEIGQLVATTFKEALQTKDAAILKILTPVFLGSAEKMEANENAENNFIQLLEQLSTPKRTRAPRQKALQVVEGEMIEVQEDVQP